jgi:hypothetical protein
MGPRRLDTSADPVDALGIAKRIKKKLPRDVNARAFAIGEMATSDVAPEHQSPAETKTPQPSHWVGSGV